MAMIYAQVPQAMHQGCPLLPFLEEAPRCPSHRVVVGDSTDILEVLIVPITAMEEVPIASQHCLILL